MQNSIQHIQQKIAIAGGGPAALFMLKHLLASGKNNYSIDIFEQTSNTGAGLPYSEQGANKEHITNVSDNEIPALVTTIKEWIGTQPADLLKQFNIDAKDFSEYRVLPRLLFGRYLHDQFGLLKVQADIIGIPVNIHLESKVTDIIDEPDTGKVWVEVNKDKKLVFDKVMICTGHNWPLKYEKTIPGYFDVPYPPAKLALKINHPVAIRGASLTAIDAIRTLARNNGQFECLPNGDIKYHLSAGSENFKLVMHSRHGMLPAVRFHLENSMLGNDKVLTEPEISAHIKSNDNFLSLDYVFDKDFKALFIDKDPEFYQRIKNMSLEEFVENMLSLRETLDPFVLMKAEYAEAEKSIRRKQSVYWKELLAVLSFALNYPAKHMSAEDMLRLQRSLQPLISLVIAFIPQSSCRELMALHDAGLLDMVAVGNHSEVVPLQTGGINYTYQDESGEAVVQHYETFVDCIGQPHLEYADVPFESLRTSRTISPARLMFRSAEAGQSAMEENPEKVVKDEAGHFYLKVPGVSINDRFQLLNAYGALNDRIYIMAVPYIGGFNPDYSGLDFCEHAAGIIAAAVFEKNAMADA